MNRGVNEILSLVTYRGMFPASPWSPRCTLGNCVCGVMSGPTLRPQYVPGCRVLARRQRDGLYYLGTAIQQVQVRRRLICERMI